MRQLTRIRVLAGGGYSLMTAVLLFAAGIVFAAEPVKQETQKVAYVSQEKLGRINITKDISVLGPLQLAIKILPINSCSVYITFPDAGNMLINTGSAGDADALISLLNEEFSRSGAGGVIRKMWKPRVDWVVLTSSDAANVGGLSKLMKKIDVRCVIMPKGMKMNVPREVTLTQLSVNEEIDVLQTVSKVSLVSLGKEKPSKGEDNFLSLKLSFEEFSFVFFLSNIPEKMFEEYRENTKNSFVISTRKLSSSAVKAIDPIMVVTTGEKMSFTTDGKRLLMDNIGSIGDVAEKVASKMMEEARKYYQQEYFNNCYKKTKEILSIEPENREANILHILCRAQIYFSRENYEQAKTELNEVFKLDPGNKEAKLLLIRVSTVEKAINRR